eukprot:m51a1_g3617 hypothetical protein (486) ;mRNA; r:72582-82210
MSRCGSLRSASGAALPLTGLSYDVRVADFAAEVTLRQRYRNDGAAGGDVEATFDFLLDDNASVSRFSARIGDRVIEAQLDEKSSAEGRYDDALAAGHGAFLLERSDEHRDAFRVSVGALPPGADALVELSYVTEAQALPLPRTGLRLVLRGAGQPLALAAPAEPSQAAFAEHFAAAFSVTASVRCSAGVRAVSSPSHALEALGTDPAGATVVRHRAEAAPGEDFVLDVELAEGGQPSARVVRDGEGGAAVAMLTFYPRLESSTARSEFVFVVDCSGSMQSCAEQLRATVRALVETMDPGRSLFNVVKFGTTFARLFDECQPVSDEALARARAYIDGIAGDMGGTNVYDPLAAVFGAPLRPGVPRQVFVLTDGGVENRDQCIALVRQHSKNQNKNNVVMATLGFLVHCGFVDEAFVFYQLTGHTHNELDQCFSSPSKYFRRNNIMSMPEVPEVFTISWAKRSFLKQFKVQTTYLNSIHNLLFVQES